MIKNAKDTTMEFIAYNHPQVDYAIFNLFRPMVFNVLTKTILNGHLNETPDAISFRGHWQNNPNNVEMKKEWQRFWNTSTMYSDTALNLNKDDIVTFETENFRVLSKGDYKHFGFYQYSLTEVYYGDLKGVN